ncbi:NHLP bacteriocin export ABC transporter permease/ATPase subunit [Pleurocapsa sp. PCC 7319]|uniref:NHLP bacteriocin export ABC transporter permease/ATPase subunit n=1 Tax=Pleurocapsa sp. PCC 7319 TaxID=118161 RepID=UPI000344D989|nr:NHLP bacteriocin export ABC transporter permease/ATPase subunit [Pleurocapsa sp. PCC 7319]
MVSSESQAQYPENLKVHTFNSNEPILLNDPQTVWQIQSGSVSLFAVTVKDGMTEENRRYLFSCESGEALFGTIANPNEIDYQILAIPMGEVTLLKLNPELLRPLITNENSNLTTLIDKWLKNFDTNLFSSTVPTIHIKAAGKESFSLNKGQTLQPIADTVVWVQLRDGLVRLLGIKELIITEQIKILPIPHDLWIEASYDTQLTTEITSSLSDIDDLLEGISLFHRHFLFCNRLIQKQEQNDELKRLAALDNLNQQVTAEALGELASPLASQKDNLIIGDTPLLIAAGAVGRSLGMKISPPGQSEDLSRLEDPLQAVARASRLRTRQVLLRDNWWEQDCGPLIGYIHSESNKQAVALLPKDSHSYELLDPDNHTRIPIDSDRAKEIEPVAQMFYRSFADKALSVFDILKFALKGRFRDILIIILTSIAITLLGMLTPQATAIMIDNSIPDSDRFSLIQIGLGLVIAAFATALFRLAQGFALLRIETTSDASTQSAMWDRLLNLPVSFFRQFTTGDLLSRTNSVSQIRRQLGSTILIKLVTSIFALLNLGLLFFYSVPLSFIAIGTAIVIIVFTVLSGSILVRKVRPLLEIEGNIFGQVVQLINGISKLRVAGAEERAFAFWSKDYSKQIKLELSTQLIEDIVAVFNTVMPILTSGILFWFTVHLLKQAETTGKAGLTVGTFLAFNSAFATFISGSTEVSNIATDILQVIPQWQRAQPIVETLPEVDLSRADPGQLIGRISIDRVSFRYSPDIPLTLENVSIKAEPGDFIALVGGSGSGKSTIFRLLLGFETPEDGSIYYDGQDLSGLDVSAVRRQLGVVLQNGTIMSGSIFDNLAGGARITLDEAWQASRMAGFDRDIDSMPMGMHTVISEGGGNLSGGQRQRLLIAKALILKPRILLFDEATSALDNTTQAIVSENLDRLQVTRIVIAHRLSTIRNADRIYVLETGRVVQQGSFEELATQKGLFSNLMKRQTA